VIKRNLQQETWTSKPRESSSASSVGENGEALSSVAVVITTYNHAHYLADAISSILTQTYPAVEIIVVDDGSLDNPAEVIAQFPSVRFIRQENQGLSSARNTGLAATTAEMVIFLDADDRLLPNALEHGVRCHRQIEGCAFVYGGYRNINHNGEPIGKDRYDAISGTPGIDFLRGNIVGMHATVMYRKDSLVRHGGFDTSLQRCEDYDLYLRMAFTERIASYPSIVAEYRRHASNMTLDHQRMLKSALFVLDRQKNISARSIEESAAFKEGQRRWRRNYAIQALIDTFKLNAHRFLPVQIAMASLAAIRISPVDAVFAGAQLVKKQSGRRIPAPLAYRIKRLRGKGLFPFGKFRVLTLSRTRPVSLDFGFDRGTPVDRYYIEAFLHRCTADIKGRVLEIGDDSYTRRFGGGNVTIADVLHIDPEHPQATIIGDLSKMETLPADSFDCMILTQTLHLIYDLQAAALTIHHAMKAGGVALLTVPGISQVDRGEWAASWYWAIMPTAALKLFGEIFGVNNVEVASHGNVYAATAFLQGLAVEEVSTRKLDVYDPSYPLVVTIRLRKQG
jgi:glycosyltransferase involved in cell wall biosynthesis/SAM-dependent methyltransferase